MSKHHLPALALASGLLVACAAPQPLVTPTELATAEANGTLAALYNQARSELVGKDRNNKKDAPLFAQLDGIGRRLASELDADLRKQIEDARLLNSKLVPLDVLAGAKTGGEPMRTWEPSRHDVFNKDIARETATTEKAVRDVQAYLGKLTPTSYRKQMDALAQLQALTGDTRYGDQREATLRSVRAQFEQARNTDDFEKALVLLDELPRQDDTDATRIELQTRLFERRFNEALADDNPDEAYRLFDTLAKSPYFEQVKTRLGSTGNDMSNYFVALAANATAIGNIADAYRWFAQARNVRLKLDGKVEAVPEEKAFVDRMQRGHDAAKGAGLWGLAYGYLQLVNEFEPSRLSLPADVRAAEEQLAKASLRSAAVVPFTSAAGNADYSTAIATRITEHLFQNIPHDARIIAWDNKTASFDYVISGSIDEARVEGNESTTRKTQRVVTARNVMVRNPKYDEWLKLGERERRSVPQPVPQTVSDKQEDVSYNVTSLRKVAYFSVAFRVVEAATGKVQYTDSLTLRREFSAEGNEGVDLGEFQLPAKAATLPSDVEILNGLSNEASQEIGKRLAEQVGHLEQRFAAAGKQAAGNGNPIEAAQQYALATSVAQRKRIDDAEWRAELKRTTAASGYAR